MQYGLNFNLKNQFLAPRTLTIAPVTQQAPVLNTPPATPPPPEDVAADFLMDTPAPPPAAMVVPTAPASKKKLPWVWIGVGSLGALGLGFWLLKRKK